MRSGRENPNPEPKAARPAGRVVSIDAGDHRERVRQRRDALVLEHAGLVRAAAERLKATVAPASIDLDDLIQTGMIALLHAATRYRPEAHGGAPFGAYARKAVRGAMLESFSGRKYTEARMLALATDEESGQAPAMAATVEEAIDDRRLAARIEDAIAYLDADSQQVIREYYRDGGTLESAGEALGMDRRRAGELHADAIAQLRQILHARP